MSKFSHYVIFTPLAFKGIYTRWEDVKKLVEGTRGASHLGFWSQQQAELALTYGYRRAQYYREELIQKGLDKPQPELNYPKFEW